MRNSTNNWSGGLSRYCGFGMFNEGYSAFDESGEQKLGFQRTISQDDGMTTIALTDHLDEKEVKLATFSFDTDFVEVRNSRVDPDGLLSEVRPNDFKKE